MIEKIKQYCAFLSKGNKPKKSKYYQKIFKIKVGETILGYCFWLSKAGVSI